MESSMGVAQPDGRAVINRPRVSHHPAGQDSSGRGRFPPAGRLTALTMTGVKVARARFRLSRGTWEPVVTMPREMPKWKPHEVKGPMRGTGTDQPVVCAGQRLDPEGSSPWLMCGNRWWHQRPSAHGGIHPSPL